MVDETQSTDDNHDQVINEDKPLIVGKTYLVPCVRFQSYYLPVLCSHIGDISGEFHRHLDMRFVSDKAMKDLDMPKDVIIGIDRVGKIFYAPLVCKRQFEPVKKMTNIESFKKLQDMMQNKIMSKCLKCPHQGVNLKQVPSINGRKSCPAHGLVWDEKTGENVPLVVEKNGTLRFEDEKVA